MKKAILAFVLLAVVLGVSYYKAELSEQRYDTAFESGLAKSAELLTSSLARVDSLSNLIIELENDFGSFSIAQKQDAESKLDSLNELLILEKERSAKLEAKQENKLGSLTKNDSGNKKDSQHGRILTYYKKRFADLPKDLSDYEKKAARNEIRQETASKYSITTAELDRIRKQNNLRY